MSTEALEVSPELRRGRNQLAATVVVGHAVKHVYNSALQSILFPEIKIGLGLSGTQLGTLAFSRQATSWVTTVVAGFLGDRFADRASLMLGISMLMMGVSYFLLGMADSVVSENLIFIAVLAIMLLVGVGPSLYHPPAIGALSRRFPDRRGFAISLHGTGGSVGEVAGPLLAGVVLLGWLALSWDSVLVYSLFPALVCAVAIWLFMRNVPGGEMQAVSSVREYFSSLLSLLKRKALYVLVIVTALRSVGQSSVMIFLPVYLRESVEEGGLGFSASKVAIYLSLAQVVGIVAQPVMGYLADKFGYKPVLVPSMFVMSLLAMTLGFADPEPFFWEISWLVVTIMVMGTVLYALHAIFIAAAIEAAAGAVQSTVVSLIYGASFIGTLSPVIAGLMWDNYGVQATFVYGGALVLVGTLVLAVMLRLPGRERATAAAG